MTVLALLLGFVGALCGGVAAAVVSGRYARQSTEQRELAGRREEWGRRFTLAVEQLARSEHDAQRIGVTLVGALSKSRLAGPDDVQLARALIPLALRQPGSVQEREPHVYVMEDDE